LDDILSSVIQLRLVTVMSGVEEFEDGRGEDNGGSVYMAKQRFTWIAVATDEHR
jgi:hypothetical protein